MFSGGGIGGMFGRKPAGRRRRFERERAEHASCEKRVRRGIVRHVRDAEICSRRVETSPEDASG